MTGGALVTRYENYLFERAQKSLMFGGSAPSPFDCWLAQRGLTLSTVLCLAALSRPASAAPACLARQAICTALCAVADEASKALNELRPRYYDPRTPPAASKAVVKDVGLEGRTITLDMIAAPK